MTVNACKWAVLIPLTGSEAWFELCVCDTMGALLSVVQSLTRPESAGPLLVKIEKRAVIT